MKERFETERLILRPWREEDAEELYRYARDDRVGPVAGWPVHTGVENSREIIRGVLSADGTYAVVLKDGGLPVGSIGLMVGKASNLEIPEAVREIIKYAFEELGMETLWCGYFDGNEKSRRVQEKCGFVYRRTDRDIPWPLMGDIRTEHISCIERRRWEEGDK